MTGKALIPYKKPVQRVSKHKTVSRLQNATPPPVVKVARVFDEATNFAFDRFAAQSDLGERVIADVPCEKSESVRDVRNELRKRNAALTAKASDDAIQAAIELPPQEHLRHAAQSGWYRGRQDAFVRSTHVVGAATSVEKLLPPRPEPGKKRQIVFGNAGTIEAWQRDVARRARWSTRAILMLGYPSPDRFSVCLGCSRGVSTCSVDQNPANLRFKLSAARLSASEPRQHCQASRQPLLASIRSLAPPMISRFS